MCQRQQLALLHELKACTTPGEGQLSYSKQCSSSLSSLLQGSSSISCNNSITVRSCCCYLVRFVPVSLYQLLVHKPAGCQGGFLYVHACFTDKPSGRITPMLNVTRDAIFAGPCMTTTYNLTPVTEANTSCRSSVKALLLCLQP